MQQCPLVGQVRRIIGLFSVIKLYPILTRFQAWRCNIIYVCFTWLFSLYSNLCHLFQQFIYLDNRQTLLEFLNFGCCRAIFFLPLILIYQDILELFLQCTMLGQKLIVLWLFQKELIYLAGCIVPVWTNNNPNCTTLYQSKVYVSRYNFSFL